MIGFKEFLTESLFSKAKKYLTANSRREALKSKIDSKMDDRQVAVIGRKVNGDASKAENNALGNDKRYSSLNKRRMKVS